MFQKNFNSYYRSSTRNQSPMVSVIMNCYNGEFFLKESIESVLKQTYRNWELIFWDNQSNDSSAKVFKSYSDRRLKYFYAKRHTALGEARNQALKLVSGELIAFLDCDDLWMPEKLEKQVPLFEDNKIGIVICDTFFFNNAGNIRQLYKKNKPPQGDVFKQLLQSYFISLETVVIRKSMIDKHDCLFDPDFQLIEEFDFFIRLSKSCELAYVDEVLAKWRVHSKSWTWSKSELFPLETRKFLSKINTQIPGFDSLYKNEVKAIERKILTHEAIILWKSGNVIEARKIFINNFNCQNILLWGFTFLPFNFFNFFNRLRHGLYD